MDEVILFWGGREFKACVCETCHGSYLPSWFYSFIQI